MVVEEELLNKYKKIIFDITADEIMNPNVVSLTSDHTLHQAKEMMRIKAISGIPIVNKIRELVGIISIEDIIKALEFGYIEDKIANRMSKDVRYFLPKDGIEKILSDFERYGYGRFPVINEKHRVIGVITKEDILIAMLRKLGALYVRDIKRNELLEESAYSILLLPQKRVESKEANFSYKINSFDINTAGLGALKLKKFLLDKGYPEKICRRASIATYEAEVNVIIHSGVDGKIDAFLNENRIIVKIEDKGKGIEDVNKAMQEGYSTASDHIRELGFGAGMGLSNMKRYSDKMVLISSKGKGTTVELTFIKRG